MPYTTRCEASGEIVALLERAVRDGVCTAWSAACKDWHASAFPADEWAPGPGRGAHPVFDLASLTKPLFVPALLAARVSDPAWWHEPRPSVGSVTPAKLRDHLSGARAWFWMGRAAWAFKAGEAVAKARFEGRTREETREHARALLTEACVRALREPAVAPGETLYSDANYFLLARIFEEDFGDGGLRGSGHGPDGGNGIWVRALETLNAAQGTAFRHASLAEGSLPSTIPMFPYLSLDADAASGEQDGREAFGPVHDTNASLLATALGGVVSGHAGLLGTVADVDAALPSLAARLPAFLGGTDPTARFQGGLDTPSGLSSTAGLRNFPLDRPGSIVGHLGFTGTSFWLDRGHEGSIARRHVLLTNRTASRTAYGSGVPRLLVFTTPAGEWIWGGRSRGTEFEETPEEEWRALALEFSESRAILWNRDMLRAPPDVGALRRSFGLRAWDR